MIRQADAGPHWVLGFQDEVWWSRSRQPDVSSWATAGPARLVQQDRQKGDGPQALSCYGVPRRDTGAMLLRFVAGRPVSQVTEDFLGWACGVFAAEGKRVFVLVWDNAAWHISHRVTAWIAAHNARVAAGGGCRIEVCGPPIRAPWLNPIEPKWMHGKKAIAEPARTLTAEELMKRVYEYYGCPAEPLITQKDA